MPLTFLSHQAPVLPLKIAAPGWCDGTALVIGSMAPDLVFVLHGTRWYPDAHGLAEQLWLCLPLTIVLTWVVKRVVAGPLGANLPDAGPLHLRDYARLDAWRVPLRPLPWLVLLASALIGSCSHLALDSFTHGFGWVVQNVGLLRTELFVLPAIAPGRTVFVHDALQLAGTVVGALVTVWCLLVIGRRRLLVEWYPTAPTPPPTAAGRRILVAGIAAGLLGGLVVATMTRQVGGAHDLIIRVTVLTFVGLLAGCVRARRASQAEGEAEAPSACEVEVPRVRSRCRRRPAGRRG